MADELEILTKNSAGNSWVDSVPGPVSTGYQAQNTNIQARSVGMDLSYVSVSGTDVIVTISGPIDDSGIPFVIKSPVTLRPPSDGTYYIQVSPGSDKLKRSLELISDAPVFDPIKMGLYSRGHRILNWVVTKGEGTVQIARMLWQPGGAVAIPGDAHIRDDLIVRGNIHSNGSMVIAGDAHIRDDLIVRGNIHSNGSMVIGGDFDFDFDFEIIPGDRVFRTFGEYRNSSGTFDDMGEFVAPIAGTYRVSATVGGGKDTPRYRRPGTGYFRITKNGAQYSEEYSVKGLESLDIFRDIQVAKGDRVGLQGRAVGWGGSWGFAAGKLRIGYGNRCSTFVRSLLGSL